MQLAEYYNASVIVFCKLPVPGNADNLKISLLQSSHYMHVGKGRGSEARPSFEPSHSNRRIKTLQQATALNCNA